MLLHALILATLQLNLAELVVALCKRQVEIMSSLRDHWGNDTSFTFFEWWDLDRVEPCLRKPCSKEMSGDFCGCDKKVLAASNPFSGNKSP